MPGTYIILCILIGSGKLLQIFFLHSIRRLSSFELNNIVYLDIDDNIFFKAKNITQCNTFSIIMFRYVRSDGTNEFGLGFIRFGIYDNLSKSQ